MPIAVFEADDSPADAGLHSQSDPGFRDRELVRLPFHTKPNAKAVRDAEHLCLGVVEVVQSEGEESKGQWGLGTGPGADGFEIEKALDHEFRSHKMRY